MVQSIDGRAYAKKLRQSINDEIENGISKGYRRPCLASILTTKDGGSIYYVRSQKKICEDLGIIFKTIFIESETNIEDEILQVIDELNDDKSIDGIMVQLPLPSGVSEGRVLNRINPDKDVDGLTELNTGRFYSGKKSFVPCTPRSVVSLIKSLNMNISGMNAVVIGRSNIVGKPVAQLLLNENTTVTICHSKTKELKEICKRADILVCAIGKPLFIDDSFVKKGAIIIDVGTSSLNGRICGDVDYDKASKLAGFISPVPGGVGAVTTTFLIKNTCEAWKKNVH